MSTQKHQYTARLDNQSFKLGPNDQRPPRSHRNRALRFTLRIWLVPLQLYLICLVLSIAIFAIDVWVPGLLPDLLQSTNSALDFLHIPPIIRLMPLAAVTSKYPWLWYLFLGLLLLLIYVDWQAGQDRRYERKAGHHRTSASLARTNMPRLLGDYPYEEKKEGKNQVLPDPLGYHSLVNVIAQLILNSASSSPFALAIEAQWGMGKSTAMQMIERRLRDRLFPKESRDWHCYTIYFNVWKYSGSDVRSAMLSTIFDKLPPKAANWYFGRGSQRHLVRLGLDILSLAFRSGDAGVRIANHLDRGARYRNEFEDDLRRVLDHWAQVEGRRPLLVVFIDDLDRCAAPEVLQVFEMMKLFFDVPGCVFVFGFDPVRVADIIQGDSSRGLGQDGSTYLKKLIQLNYVLPRPDDDAFKAFIRMSIADARLEDFFDEQVFRTVGGYFDLLLQGTGRNPREIRRFINAVVVSSEMVASQLNDDVDYVALCLLLLLQIRWPHIYFDLVEASREGQLSAFIQDIEQYISNIHTEETREDKALRAFVRDYQLGKYTEIIDRLIRSGLPTVTSAARVSESESADQASNSEEGRVRADAREEARDAAREEAREIAQELARGLSGAVVTSEPLGPPFDIGLLPVPDHFVGREQEIAWLLNRLRSGEMGGITAITGIGGIGKTSLAAVTIQRLYEERRFPDGIAVTVCTSLRDPAEVLRRTLARFDPFRRQPIDTDLPTLGDLAQAQLRGKRSLIVLDNVEPELPLDLITRQLLAADATLLVTSRHRLPVSVIPVEGSLTLSFLPTSEALELFAQSMGRGLGENLTPSEHAAAERIVMTVGNYTLAIKLAGALAATTARDLVVLAKELEDDPGRALTLSDQGGSEAVLQVLDRSITELPESEQRLFAALSTFASAEFGRNAAASLGENLGLIVRGTNRSLDLLTLRGLLEVSINDEMPEGSDRERIRLHPILRAFAENQLVRWSVRERANAHRALATYYGNYVSRTPISALGPDEMNITAALEWAYAQNEDALVAVLCDGMSGYWIDRGRIGEALTYLPWGIAAATHIKELTELPEEQLRVARLNSAYADMLLAAGQSR